MSSNEKINELYEHLYQDSPVPMEKRTITPLSMGFDWFSIMIIGTMWLVPAIGVTIIGDFWLGILAGWIGNTLGAVIIGLVGIPSFKYGLPTITIARTSFGRVGADIPAFLQGFMMLFWTWVQTILGAIAANEFSKIVFGWSNYPMWVIGIGVISALVAYHGFRYISLFEKIAFPILVFVFVGVLVIMLTNFNMAEKISLFNSEHISSRSWANWVAAFEVVFATMLTWALMPGDFARFSTSIKSPAVGLPVGIFLGANLLVPIAAVGLVTTGQIDPGNVMAEIAKTVAPGWGLVFLIGFVVATITTNFVTIYCSAVALGTIKRVNVTPHFVKSLFFVVGVLAVLGGLYKGWLNVEIWIIYMASFLAPTCGIVVTNFIFIENKLNISAEAFLNKKGEMMFGSGFNKAGCISWVIGVIIYWAAFFWLSPNFKTPMFVSLILSSVIYLIWTKDGNPIAKIPEDLQIKQKL